MTPEHIRFIDPPRTCPLGHRWHQWGFDEILKCLGDRSPRLTGYRTLSVMPLHWTLGPGDPSNDGRRRPGMTGRTHRHSEFSVLGRVVHVDAFEGVRVPAGPGFGFDAVHVYVNGILAARSYRFGCVYGGGGCPRHAWAPLGEGLLLKARIGDDHVRIYRKVRTKGRKRLT